MNSTAEMVRLSDFDRDEYEPRWGQLVAGTLMPMSVRVEKASPAKAGAWQRKTLGDLSLAYWDCPASQGTRRRADVRRGDPEIVVLFFADSGEELIDNGDSKVVLSPGRGLLFSSSQSFSFKTVGSLRKRSLILPRVALDEVAPRLTIGNGLPLETSRPAVRLLREFLGLLWPTLHRMTPAEVQAARTAVLSLLSGAAGPEEGPDGHGAMAALRKQMDAWIDENLAYGPLTVAGLAAAHHVSVRTVQRVFARDAETVSSVVRRRRLAQARSELVHSSLPIAIAAARAGYFDPSHFAREFRRFYGETPRQHRARNAHKAGDAT
ncbi:MAG: putative transcriptional regulator [Actinomycetia bacterium]|nr:putative transcriptional regulator [Actinomycetes bacterium]